MMGVAESGASRVLVVDDDPAITRIVRRVLDSNHEVVAYNEARVALAVIAGGARFDLILCDVFMPDLAGESFYDAVLLICPATAARIVFLTGSTSSAPGAGFLHNVPNRRLAKPFNVAEFRTTVADIIRVSGRWKVAPKAYVPTADHAHAPR
jgi:CheY-like chemotaxis protein